MSTHYQIGYFEPAAGEPVVNLPGGGQVVGAPFKRIMEADYGAFTMLQGIGRCSCEQQSEASSPQQAARTRSAQCNHPYCVPGTIECCACISANGPTDYQRAQGWED